jgi:hypothetical protein
MGELTENEIRKDGIQRATAASRRRIAAVGALNVARHRASAGEDLIVQAERAAADLAGLGPEFTSQVVQLAKRKVADFFNAWRAAYQECIDLGWSAAELSAEPINQPAPPAVDPGQRVRRKRASRRSTQQLGGAAGGGAGEVAPQSSGSSSAA